jgi:threonine aldolase
MSNLVGVQVIILLSPMSRIILYLELTFICNSNPLSVVQQLILILSAPTEVIALENTLNGTIFPQEEILAISDFARSQSLKMHLDGARIWHVAAETATPIKDLCDPFDSVSLCFSKGLGQ